MASRFYPAKRRHSMEAPLGRFSCSVLGWTRLACQRFSRRLLGKAERESLKAGGTRNLWLGWEASPLCDSLTSLPAG